MRRDPRRSDLVPPYRTASFRALGFHFDVTTPTVEARELVERLLQPLVVSEPAGFGYQLSVLSRDVASGSAETVIVDFAGSELARTTSMSDAASLIVWHMTRMAVAVTDGHLLLHAAAVERDGTGMILAAPSGAGKTTLAAGLLMEGFRYLTDEVVAVEFGTLLLVPFAKPLTMKRAAHNVVPALSALGERAASGDSDSWLVPPLAMGTDTIASSCWPSVIVFPHYVPRARTSLVALDRREAVALLAESCFHLRGGQRSLETLVELVRVCRCFLMTVGDLAAACAALTSDLPGSEARVARR